MIHVNPVDAVENALHKSIEEEMKSLIVMLSVNMGLSSSDRKLVMKKFKSKLSNSFIYSEAKTITYDEVKSRQKAVFEKCKIFRKLKIHQYWDSIGEESKEKLWNSFDNIYLKLMVFGVFQRHRSMLQEVHKVIERENVMGALRNKSESVDFQSIFPDVDLAEITQMWKDTVHRKNVDFSTILDMIKKTSACLFKSKGCLNSSTSASDSISNVCETFNGLQVGSTATTSDKTETADEGVYSKDRVNDVLGSLDMDSDSESESDADASDIGGIASKTQIMNALVNMGSGDDGDFADLILKMVRDVPELSKILDSDELNQHVEHIESEPVMAMLKSDFNNIVEMAGKLFKMESVIENIRDRFSEAESLP